MNNSAIKKMDYILSKDKFTKNILQGHPLKEDKKVLQTEKNKGVYYPIETAIFRSRNIFILSYESTLL